MENYILAIYFTQLGVVERYHIPRTDEAFKRAMAKAVAKHGTLASFTNWENIKEAK